MKNKKYKNQKIFYDPVFRAKIIVKMNNFGDDSTTSAKITSEIKKGVKTYILIFSKIDIADLDHELIHLVSQIFFDRSISLDLNTDVNQEVFGYYHCYWLETIWKAIKYW